MSAPILAPRLIHIRPEHSADAAGIRAVQLAAFAPSPNEAELVDLLRRARQATIAWVALIDDQIAGHILFSPVTLIPALPARRGLGLAPLAVRSSDQGFGIGSRLVMRGLEACRAAGADFVVVLGHPGYYPRFGFRRASTFGLQNEYGADEAFMVIELRPGGLMGVQGLVPYRPEFAAANC